MSKLFEQVDKKLIFEPYTCGFKTCHASNICMLKNHSLMCVWFAGTSEGADDIAVWGARLINDNFEKPKLLARDKKEPHWNPVLFDADGEVLLFYKVGRDISSWQTKIRRSNNDGLSFGEAVDLVPGDYGGRGPVRCKVIRLSDGSIIAGNSIERGVWAAFADKSNISARKWTLSNRIYIDVKYSGENTNENSNIKVSKQSFFGRGVIQPTIWESKRGNVHMLLRSSEGYIYRADSNDYGVSFGKAYKTILPNNNSGIDVVKMDDGLLVLCLNPVGINWGKRTPLVIMTSRDNGISWNNEFTIEDAIDGEFSYPSIISYDKYVYISYTYDRKSIAYVCLKRR